MIFTELSRISNSDRATINPHAKIEPRKVRRAKVRQARLEARNLDAAKNRITSTIKKQKKSA